MWLSVDRFGWALAAVSSRAFLVRKPAAAVAVAAGEEAEEEEEAMVPLLDLCNHARPRQAEYGALDPAAVAVGLGRIVTLYYRSSTSYQIH